MLTLALLTYVVLAGQDILTGLAAAAGRARHPADHGLSRGPQDRGERPLARRR